MRKIFTLKEITEYLNCSESCVRKLKREKSIPYFRVSGKIMFDKEKIDQWITEHSVEPQKRIK